MLSSLQAAGNVKSNKPWCGAQYNEGARCVNSCREFTGALWAQGRGVSRSDGEL